MLEILLKPSKDTVNTDLVSGVERGEVKSGPVLIVDHVSKRYEIYERPQDRLKQSLVPRLQALLPARVRRSHPFFKEFWALRDVSLTVERGDAVGILGRNGAGKSTLLQIIAGTLMPTSGTVLVEGKIAALLELGSGFSPDFTGRENVRLSGALLGLTPAEIDLCFDDIAAFADIGDFLEQPVKTYSSGMLMRLAFAVQTAVEPELMIVDEALSVGDARFQKKCFARLEQLRQDGTTILFVTHDTGTIVQFCTRALILEAGTVFTQGAPSLVARRYHELLFDDKAQFDRAPAVLAHPEFLKAAAAKSEPDVGDTSAANSDANQPEPLAPSNSPREVRYGSRDAEIFEIGIRDADGRRTAIIEVHSTYEFYFKVRFNIDISNPVAYGFIFSNPRGVEIFATKSGLHGKALAPSRAGCTYECRLRATVPIVNGTYFMSVAIAHDDGRLKSEFLDCRFDALEFQVVGPSKAFATCVFDMGGELSHKQLRQIEDPSGRNNAWELQ